MKPDFESTIDLASNKVKEDKAKVAQAHSATLSKVETYVSEEIRERKVQKENAL